MSSVSSLARLIVGLVLMASAAAQNASLVFLHISKTAGTATRKALEHILDERVLTEEEKADTSLLWLETVHPGSFAWYHSPAAACDTEWCRNQDPRWITVWRDPIDRIISQYFYVRHYPRFGKEESRLQHLAHDEGIVSCVENQEEGCRRNWMTAFMCGHSSFCHYRAFNQDDVLAQQAYHSARENLLRMDYVLNQNSLHQDLKVMISRLMPGAVTAPMISEHYRAAEKSHRTGTWVASDDSCPQWMTPKHHCHTVRSPSDAKNRSQYCISIIDCEEMIKTDEAIMQYLRRANQYDILLSELAAERNAELQKSTRPAPPPSASCPAGMVQDILNGNKCTKCPVGTFHEAQSNRCKPCPRGTAQPQSGSRHCLPCNANKFGRWIGRAFCPETLDWSKHTSLPTLNCTKLDSYARKAFSFKLHVKELFTARYAGKQVLVNRLGDPTRTNGFTAGFSRAAQMSSSGAPYFPQVLGVCNEDRLLPGYVTEMILNAVSIDKAADAFDDLKKLSGSEGHWRHLAYGHSLSLARQYATALLHLISPSSLQDRPGVYCDHQTNHILVTRDTGRVIMVDLDDAPFMPDNDAFGVKCNPDPDVGMGYARKDSVYTDKRDSWKFCYFSRTLFFSNSSRTSMPREYVPMQDVGALRQLYDSCYDHNDALRPSLPMMLRGLGDIAARSKTLPLVQLEIQYSGGAELGMIFKDALSDMHWWHVLRLNQNQSFPPFAGQSCGVHPSLHSLRHCLRQKYALSESEFSFQWITTLRDPIVRIVNEYIGCVRKGDCTDTIPSNSFQDFVFNASAPQHQRQLWMLSGLTQEGCTADLSSCLSLAKRIIDESLVVIYEDFERGVKFLSEYLGVALPIPALFGGQDHRQENDTAELLQQIDITRFEESYLWELEVYGYAVRRFEALQSTSVKPLTMASLPPQISTHNIPCAFIARHVYISGYVMWELGFAWSLMIFVMWHRRNSRRSEKLIHKSL